MSIVTWQLISSVESDKGQGSCTSQYSIKFETVEEEGQGYFLRIYSVMDRPSPPSDQACKRCEEMLTLPGMVFFSFYFSATFHPLY